MSLTELQTQRARLRKTLRQRRNSLSEAEQRSAKERIVVKLQSLSQWSESSTLAGYLTNDGEVDLAAVMALAWQQGKKTTLPVIHPFNPRTLLFLDYTTDTQMRVNRFNIHEPEPHCTGVIPIATHDIILMPLVGFDARGNRLGMGGGFYDRTLAGVLQNNNRPLLVGTAHDCQQVDAIPIAGWDIPLDIIVTPSQTLFPG
ncbi:5-formyltetrahydrofolate cyclo-ligase [Aestuariibacter sp. A3R04]|uniref:5-formyltetrahydrofolate cyclo-ligase n=1 Tax=Aestuariibacter sp. A3R04 TaxID=2841571 RepID=UPI00352C7728